MATISQVGAGEVIVDPYIEFPVFLPGSIFGSPSLTGS